MRKLKVFIALLLLLPIAFMILIYFFSLYEKSKIKFYSDVNYYISGQYDDLIDDSRYDLLYERSLVYFPEYDSFGYKEEINDFSIFDGTNTITYNLSILLELKFNSREAFENFLMYEYGRFNYEYAFSYKNYVIDVVEDIGINEYNYNSKKPYVFGILCINDKELIARYLVFYDLVGYEGRYSAIIKSTIVNWD